MWSPLPTKPSEPFTRAVDSGGMARQLELQRTQLAELQTLVMKLQDQLAAVTKVPEPPSPMASASAPPAPGGATQRTSVGTNTSSLWEHKLVKQKVAAKTTTGDETTGPTLEVLPEQHPINLPDGSHSDSGHPPSAQAEEKSTPPGSNCAASDPLETVIHECVDASEPQASGFTAGESSSSSTAVSTASTAVSTAVEGGQDDCVEGQLECTTKKRVTVELVWSPARLHEDGEGGVEVESTPSTPCDKASEKVRSGQSSPGCPAIPRVPTTGHAVSSTMSGSDKGGVLEPSTPSREQALPPSAAATPPSPPPQSGPYCLEAVSGLGASLRPAP